MEKNFKILLNKISKLKGSDLKVFLELVPFQLSILSLLSKEKKSTSEDIFKIEADLSKAQKYRYLKNLLNRKLIQKDKRFYSIN